MESRAAVARVFGVGIRDSMPGNRREHGHVFSCPPHRYLVCVCVYGPRIVERTNCSRNICDGTLVTIKRYPGPITLDAKRYDRSMKNDRERYLRLFVKWKNVVEKIGRWGDRR